MLRVTQMGLSMSDLDAMSPGMLLDMYAERANDEVTYDRVATQEDFDRFAAGGVGFS